MKYLTLEELEENANYVDGKILAEKLNHAELNSEEYCQLRKAVEERFQDEDNLYWSMGFIHRLDKDVWKNLVRYYVN